MIEQICAFIHNFFVAKTYTGTFTISGGALTVDGLVEGQYIYIKGSRFNDGVCQYGVDELQDETFEGEVWDMRPPRAFVKLAGEIEDWVTKYGDTVSGPYQSESFGGYTYSLKTGTNASGGQDSNAGSWQGVFRSQLNQYRKLA
jgi:hypothetical protein